MKIEKHIYKRICSVVADTVEMGGILGSARSDVITEVAIDNPKESQSNKFEYYPDLEFLNNEIEKWINQGKRFRGFFHTHLYDLKNLSLTDKEYIVKIMKAMAVNGEELYFPIYTVSDSVMTVYKAKLIGREVLIEKDNLIILP